MIDCKKKKVDVEGDLFQKWGWRKKRNRFF